MQSKQVSKNLVSEQSVIRTFTCNNHDSHTKQQPYHQLTMFTKDQFMGHTMNKLTSSQLLQNEQQFRIIQRLMELQGQCKIKEWEFIKFNIIQAIILMILLLLSVFGLFLLKYSTPFRKFVFFNPATAKQATHVYILGNDKKRDICKILVTEHCVTYFEYKKLKYSISKFNKEKPTPTAYQFQKQFNQCFNVQRLKLGLKNQQIQKRRQLYGTNEHLVNTPSYPQYVLDVLTQPFFLLQYFFCFVFILEGYASFSIALLSFSLITTTVNYIMLYISYKKIKQIAEKIIQVKVIRNGEIKKINSSELVPGDVYIPEEQQQMVADCIVGFGDIYVNEANLTGQSFPIGKFKIQNIYDIKNSSIWVYQGSKILETKIGNTFAVVINTGFSTNRGRIIRKILNRTVKDPDILRTTLVFVLQVAIVSVITFFIILFLLLQRDIEKLFIFFKFVDFLASSIPPPLPIYFNLAYSFSLFRLAYRGIIGTQPQKTVEGAQIKTFCFDKTGTLTRNEVSIVKVFFIKNEQKLQMHNIITELGEQQNQLIWKLFATCHTTKLIKDELLGDQIDKQMFNFINATMQKTQDTQIRFVVKSSKTFSKTEQKNILLGKEQQDKIELEKQRYSLRNMKKQKHLQVLRINQFQSRFQSMSVLVHDVISKKYYIFAKGSPEKILANCSNIMTGSENAEIYIKMIKTLSLNGFRTIAMGYRQLKQTQIEYYLRVDRQKYLQDIINLGLLAFENRLKNDSWLTINRLINSNIQPKMITGDNIYIAVETARRVGILGVGQKVVFLEGNRNTRNFVTVQEPQGHFSRIFEGTIIEKIKQDIKDGQTSNFIQQVIQIHEKKDYLKGKFTFAVDNNFIKINPPPLLSHNIKIFARIPPQNKAFIIRQYKKQHNEFIRTNYSKFIRWLKVKEWKIGMCGDGANDLLALRQADLSIGIQATDASYGSSFTIKNILDVDWVIKQSKCTQANIIQLYQSYGTICFFVVICSILLLIDYTYFTTPQIMYLNFGTILLLPGAVSMSRPDGSQSQYVPDSNMMGLHNHLIFWGNLLIPFAGVLGCWFFLTNTQQYKPNPQPKVSVAVGGFNSINYSTTLIFILILIVCASNGFIIYRSKPWRQRFYNNYLFTLLISSNIAIALVFAFMTKQLQKGMQFVAISRQNMSICMAIIFGSLIINWIYNIIVSCFRLDEKRLMIQKQEIKLVSVIEKHGKNVIHDSMIIKNIQGK